MATLGELLFYIATIESDSVRDGQQPSELWEVRAVCSDFVFKRKLFMPGIHPSPYTLYRIIQMNKFWADIIDKSGKTTSLVLRGVNKL